MSDITALDRMASSNLGLLAQEQLISAGFSTRKIQRMVSSGLLRRIHRGVFVLLGTDLTWERLIGAATLSGPMRPASHLAAARLWALRSVDEDLQISVEYPHRAALQGISVHRSRSLCSADVTWVDGILVTTPERTLADLGKVLPEPEVLRILRHAIATGLVNRRDLWRLRFRLGKQGRDGIGVLGRCLASLPEKAEYSKSGLEVMFLELCERFGVPAPAVQLPLAIGGQLFRVDFAFPAHRVFVEIDGAAWHSGPTQVAADGGRQNLLVAHGWRPVRFTYNDLLHRPSRCARLVKDMLFL